MSLTSGLGMDDSVPRCHLSMLVLPQGLGRCLSFFAFLSYGAPTGPKTALSAALTKIDRSPLWGRVNDALGGQSVDGK